MWCFFNSLQYTYINIQILFVTKMWSESVLINIFGIIAALIITVIAYFKWKYSYWRNLGVEYMEPTIPFGSVYDIFLRKVSMTEATKRSYDYFKSKNVIHGGGYFILSPTYVPIDLDLIKRIMQVDFSYFTDHQNPINEIHDPFGANLFALGGEKWKKLRAKLTPTFTSGKMKNMFPIMVSTSKTLIEVLEQERQNSGFVEAKEIMARFTTDIIGSCAFGLECNSLQNPDTAFRVYGKRVVNLTGFELVGNFLTILLPNLATFLKIKSIPKEFEEFFTNAVKDTMEYREKNNIRRNDVFQLLLDMKSEDGKKDDTTLTFMEIVAQAFVFFLGGFETSSTLMSFALLELAMNEDIQTSLRNDVNKVLKENNNEFTYEAMNDMRYLDMVIQETLRKYPPIGSIPRLCTKDYCVPNTNVIIKKGQNAIIPISGIHHDPEYYPHPEIFDPMRFTEENKRERHQFAFIPFGEGPRVCIGTRFALMQAKIGLSTFIKSFKIKINSKTEIPIKFDTTNIISSVRGGVWLDLEKIVS